tara:strand:+ start:1433 stop:2014 length:582 start_codon:yes stop_codon:yes gene_type:complete
MTSSTNATLFFLYPVAVLLTTYAMRAAHDSTLCLYYISDLLNSQHDSIPEFLMRWFLWFSVVIVYLPFLLRRHGRRSAWVLGLAWTFTIASGLDLRVFGAEESSDILKYMHYAATGILMLVASVIILRTRPHHRLGWFWVVISVVYASCFLLFHISSGVDIPSEAFMCAEYVFFLTFGVVVVLTETHELTTLP